MIKSPPGFHFFLLKFHFVLAGASSVMKKINYSKFWETSYQKSLNKTFRKKELVKITFENQALLRRIQEKKSTVNFRIYEKERREKEKLLENISQYPLQIFKETQKTTQNFMENSRNNFVFSSGSIEVKILKIINF